MPMLEPHAGAEPMHTVRGFLIHIAAIAIGLLLALVLDQTVLGIHHAHERREVEAHMRDVLASNVKGSTGNLATLRSLRAYLSALRADITTHLRADGQHRQSTGPASFSAPIITLPSLAPYEAAQKDGTVTIMGSDRIRLYNRIAFVRDLALSALTDWERAIGDLQGFQKRYIDSAGAIELGGVAKGPDLGTLSPAELTDYLARVGTLIQETDLLSARLDLVDQESRALLAGARNEKEMLQMSYGARPHGFGVAIAEPPEK